MNKLIEKISLDLANAMRSKDAVRLRVLRALKSEITNASLRSGNISNEVSDIQVLAIIHKTIAKHDDSIEAFSKAGRVELIANETFEKQILQEYLPVEMGDSTLDDLVQVAIMQCDAHTKKDMGRAIQTAVTMAGGAASNQRISKAIAQYLK